MHNDRQVSNTQGKDRYNRPGPKCDTVHQGTCNETIACPFILPDGSRCNRNHLEKYCWYKDQSQAKDPRVRELIEKKLDAMRTHSQVALQASAMPSDGNRLYDIAALHVETSLSGEPAGTIQFNSMAPPQGGRTRTPMHVWYGRCLG